MEEERIVRSGSFVQPDDSTSFMTRSIESPILVSILTAANMAPSRGFSPILRARYSFCKPQRRRYSEFVQAVTNASNKSQIYISRILDPYVNLSIEHYLLQNSPTDSMILFLYLNEKSVIIGRNQNPWVETHIPSLKYKYDTLLVRRRSGGGTVFHDRGNVNYSVICPTPDFDRDKHAQMVVRALHKLGVDRVRVNERHDIVMDRIGTGHQDPRPLKVSGSAYKLTRLRSLHHGTCLLSSENLPIISKILWSPSKRYINARGVDSVSSPVANVNVDQHDFEDAVVAEFNELYKAGEPMVLRGNVASVPEIVNGVEELKSPDWIYSQTPQFTLSTHNSEYDHSKDTRKGSWDDLPDPPPKLRADLTVRNGKIIEAEIKFGEGEREKQRETEWTINGRYTGRSEIPLTPNGESQVSSSARKVVGLGKIIDPSKVAYLFISPRIRAQRTFELLFDGATQKALESISETTEDIREWDYGKYEGLLTAQIRSGRKERGLDTERPWNIWVDGCEDGESAAEVSSRLDRVIGKIREIQGPYMHGEKSVDVVLIAHGHILRAFAKRWIGFELGATLPMMLEPGAVGVLSYEHHKVNEPAFLLGVNMGDGEV
ncbi:Sedoheptulose 1 [Hyphodiscus hymeniophilus]|uniref:Putative lipoate-protein ligase A n=1 Tax=Hyphodiscus hymeniophilus TaxID=353542 RepID=A0A9P6VE08_9HELO|nr:Sedoheptulose 1 [Hyphodiscus hymeniophilus]